MPELEEQVTEENRLKDIALDAFGEDDDNDGQVLEAVKPLDDKADESVIDKSVIDEPKEEAVVKETQPEKVEEKSSETPDPEPVVKETPAMDREIQQLQQMTATYQGLVQKLLDNPTPENKVAVEKQKTKLDLIVESKSEDVDPYEAAKTVAQEVQSLQASGKQQTTDNDKTIATLRAQLDATNKRQERIEFHQNNPGIADQYDNLVGELNKAVDDFRPADGEIIPTKTWEAIVNREWKSILDVANAKASEAKAEAETKIEDEVVETVKTPVATNPIKTTKGTRSKPKTDPKALMNELRDNAFGDFEE